MKSFAIIIMMAALISPVFAADVTPEENAEVAAAVRKLYKMKTKVKRIDSPAMQAVTDAVLYDVNVRVEGPDGSSTETVMLIKKGDSHDTIAPPHTNQDYPELKALIKEGFTLKSDADAKTFEAVLDLLFPIHEGFKDKDEKAKAILREANRVTFIRGEFFKDLKGFIVKTDDAGAIVDVDYSLRIKRK